MNARNAILLTLVVAGCVGEISRGAGEDRDGRAGGQWAIDPAGGDRGPGSEVAGQGPGADGDPSDAAHEPTAQDICRTLDVGITPLRRLTRDEYDNTVADLLGDESRPARSFSADEKLLGFSAGLNVTPLLVDQYMTASEELAQQAVTDLPGLLGCDPVSLDAVAQETCAHDFIDSFGARAYRRPLQSEEREGLRALFALGRDDFDVATGVELVLRALLQSPQFLYRVELGEPTETQGLYRLTGHELATRLSYFVWQTMPDESLDAAAEAGELDAPEGVERWARSMVEDPRARRSVDSFHAQWLELEQLDSAGKDPDVYPELDDALRESMAHDLLAFTGHVVFEGAGTLEALLTASYGFVDRGLAAIYGLDPAGFGDEPERTELDAAERAGIVTSPAVMTILAKANQSSPVHRGKFVRERLLCQPLSPPPADLVIIPPDPDPEASTRERFAEHAQNPACAGCHQLTDPIGFGFEHYDGIGRYRAMDGDFSVDARGEVIGSKDIDGTFEGAIELARRLSQSQEVSDCVAGQWFVYAFGRSMTNQLDACSAAQVRQAFAASGHDIKSLIVALATSDAFRHRRIEGGSP